MPDSARDTLLVSVDWLAARLTAPDVVVVDGSWYMPATGRNAAAEHLERHIPGAVFFDIDAIADTTSPLPHMLPRPEAFASAMRKRGIGDGHTIVVYDGAGLFSAPRVWWTFRTFGARDVRVLDGGLPAWVAAGLPVESGPVARPERHFTARLDHSAVADLAAVEAASRTGARQIVDARSAGRFAGVDPEPREGLRSGHMPGARNLPFDRLVRDGRLVPDAEIAGAFAAAGVDRRRPVVTTCGSGVTAAVLTFALATLGAEGTALYDGSWTEWGGRTDTAVATGAP